MEKKRYRLRYLPLFVSDMEEFIDYIMLQSDDVMEVRRILRDKRDAGRILKSE